MLKPELSTALETRAEWVRWARSDHPSARQRRQEWAYSILERTAALADRAEVFYANPNFMALVDHARVSVPDDLEFDPTWLIAKQGWLYVDPPMQMPLICGIKEPRFKDVSPERIKEVHQVRALGWMPIPAGVKIPDLGRAGGSETDLIAPPNAYWVVCYQSGSAAPQIYNPWSFFVLIPGWKLGARLSAFEAMNRKADDGSHYDNREGEEPFQQRHEIRWTYTILHLMAQRMTTLVTHQTDRATRHRLERVGHSPVPTIRVVSLRRLEEARKQDQAEHKIDWQWQWSVTGHWRNQWCPSTQSHKPTFIEAYIKGPPSMPFKPAAIKIYAAIR